MKTVSADELGHLLANDESLVLIDVMPNDCFQSGHLPGARNACVYEVVFIDEVKKAAPVPAAQIVVYGSSSRNLASEVAAGKLLAAGWKNVSDFRGGIEEWRSKGYSVEGTNKQLPAPGVEDGVYTVDTTGSTVEWTGRNLGGKHTGTINLSSGEITIQNRKVTKGHFVIDMKTIRNTDLDEASMRALLVKHLMSDDFFEVEKYPEARFTISSAEELAGVSPGSPNCRVKGKMKIKDVEREIEFLALIARKDDQVIAQTHFDIDRTQWNVIYGSGRFFENLGMHLVNDLISIQLKLVLV